MNFAKGSDVADRDELQSLRRLAELEAKAGQQAMVHKPPPAQPSIPLQAGSPIAGGPLMALFGESQKAFNEELGKGAYNLGGAVTDITGSPVAGGATNAAVNAIPSLVGALGGKLAESATRPLARALMQSALKPSSKDIATGDAKRAIETMLTRGHNVTPGGAAQMRGKVSQLSQQADDLIAGSTATVDRSATVRPEIIETLKKFRNQVNPSSDVSSILKSWDEFRHTTPPQIPVQKAQELKKGTYRLLADKYAHLGTVGDEAATQSQMAMARGLRKGVEQAVPGVVAPNKEMAALINALEMAERRSGVAANRDLASIAFLSPHAATTGAMLADRSPWIKSLLARYLHSGMPATGAAAATTAGPGMDLLLNDPMRKR